MIKTTAIFTMFLTVVSILAATAFYNTPSAEAAAIFRILDVRAEYGHLIVEVQHFNADGSHWFYENYTWQGRQQFRQPRVTDQRGQIQRLFLRSDGRVAPTRIVDGKRRHYLPRGEQWLRHNRPQLDADSIKFVIGMIHAQRLESGWTRGRQRLTTHEMEPSGDDTRGAASLARRFSGLRGTAHAVDDAGTLMAYAGPALAPIDPFVSTEWGTTSTFSPSLDGMATRDPVSESFASIRGGNGDNADYGGAAMTSVRLIATTTTNEYGFMRRGFVLFDTSSLPDSDGIDSATFGFVALNKADGFGSGAQELTNTTIASDSAVVASDYQGSVGDTTRQAPAMSISSITADSSTFNTMTLNSTGEGNINKTGITRFGMKTKWDVDNSAPSWSSGAGEEVEIATSEETVPGDKAPLLTVVHTAPSAAITGTIGDGALEQEVRNGGTILITLTGTTWVATGGTFNAQRQNIIDGLDSAQSETTGWNNEVRDELGVSSVVRSSDTLVTITITAADVSGYSITSNETITMTVPASATGIASAITATPTITVTAGDERVAVSGTLEASGGTAAEIVAGGETIILTLTGTEWVADGTTFDGQRQNIIDGLTSNLSDQNGWDNRRPDFAVTDVVRTSATVVTITLSASSAYAIPQTETITAVVPASALVFGAALTGAPTFEIVPAFVLSGNRISGPIDLSGITDVAYCAVGWQASTPSNTTVTVKTSIDGGANYSSATNGSCPTGITVGDSLSSITDFRIQVELATSDNSVTPLVQGLGLLVQDTSGPALYYRLNTVPGVTITDRSANSNTGTMSFPTSQTGINSTTGVLESTRSSLSLEQLLSVGDIVSPVTGAAASGNIFNQTETGFGSLPFQSMMQTMATGGELPLKFVWVVAIGLFSIALGVVALHMTGSLMISGIGLGAGLSIGAAIGGGLIPGWTVILFVILALALVVMRARGALPL